MVQNPNTGEPNGEPTNPNTNPNPDTTGEPNKDNKQNNNNDDDDTLNKFQKIKESYENKLSDKDKQIEELKEQLKQKEQKVGETIDELSGEVNEKLEQAEKMKELQATVNELLKDKAEATVDTFIQQGKIAPAQRETALKLCLSDNDTFMELYKNAKPIVETQQRRTSVPAGTAQRIVSYLKK